MKLMKALAGRPQFFLGQAQTHALCMGELKKKERSKASAFHTARLR